RHPRRSGGGLPRGARGRPVRPARPRQGDYRYQVRQERFEHPEIEDFHRQGRRDLAPRPRRGDRRTRQPIVMTRAARYLPLLVLAFAWEAVARFGLVSALALPTLTDVAIAWFGLMRSGELVTNGLDSIYRAAAGLSLAIVLGGLAGVFMAYSRPVNIL